MVGHPTGAESISDDGFFVRLGGPLAEASYSEP